MSCLRSRRLSSRSSVWLLRCALIVAAIACFHNQSAPWLQFAALAAKVVHVVNRYSEITRGAMIAPQIVDKFLALPAAFMRAAKMIGNPAQDSTKGKRPRRSNGCGSFAMRVARHDKLPNDLERTLLAWCPRFHPITAEVISGRVVCYMRQQALFSGQLCVA